MLGLIILLLTVDICLVDLSFGQELQYIGVPGGRIRGSGAIAINPKNPDIILCGTEEGYLFKSSDGGKSSQRIFGVSAGSDILFNPQNPDIVYTSIYKSTDGGDTWKRMSWDGYLAINPLNPNRIFRSSYGFILVSNDGGDTWELIKKFSVSHKIKIADSDTGVIYLVAYDSVYGYGLYKSVNSGESWEITNLKVNSPILSMAINPYNSSVVYVGTKEEGVYKTSDGGYTWKLILGTRWANDIAIDPKDTSVVYVVTGDYLYRYPGDVFKSTDGGSSWLRLNQGLPRAWDRFIYSVEINPQNSQEVYIGTYGFGVFKTSNGGSRWYQTNICWAPTLYVYIDPFNSHHLYIGTPDEGILFTPDDGESWQIIDFGVPTVQSFFRQFTFAGNTNVAYVAGGCHGLFKSTDGGKSWFLTSLRGSFDTFVWTVNVYPDNPDILYVGQVGWIERDLYKSTDGGLTWVNLHAINSEGAINKVVFDPQNPSTIYVAAGDKGILKSTDGGLTWETIFANNGVDPPFMSVAVRWDSTNIIYVVRGASGNSRGGVYLSKNGGKEWFLISSTLESLDKNVSAVDIAISPVNPSRVYVSLKSHGMLDEFSAGGLFFTEDNGRSWRKLYHGSVGAISISPHDPTVLYVTTETGIIKLTDTLGTSDDKSDSQLIDFHLYSNYPNPFNFGTKIRFYVPEETAVKIKIYDISGRELLTLKEERVEKGYHEVFWDGKDKLGRDLPSGVYLYQLETPKFKKSRKMVKLK